MHKHEIRANTSESSTCGFQDIAFSIFAVPYLDSRGHSVMQAFIYWLFHLLPG